MKIAAALAINLMLSGPLLAQTQNTAQTGAGGALESLEAVRAAVTEQWDGVPGRVVKGAGGLAGLAAAVSAANKALTFKLRVRGDGSLDASGGTPVTPAPSISTGAATSSSTATN